MSDPYDNYGSLHDWGPLRRTASQVGGPLGAGGSLRAVYTVKRGTSPRIVKAAIIGSGGTKYIDGSSLRMKLGLNSSWAVFTKHGHQPGRPRRREHHRRRQAHAQGRIYPALAAGAEVTMHFYYDGRGARRAVADARAQPRGCPAATPPGTPPTASGQPRADHQVLLLARQGGVADDDHHGREPVRAAARAW